MSEAKKDLQAERLVLHKNSLRESDSSHTLRMTVKNELGSADENYIPNPLIIDDLLAFADVSGDGEVGATDYLIAYATLYEKEIRRNWMEWIYFDGQFIGADQFGNLNMAYVGAKCGIPEWVFNNIVTRDDQRDIDMIEYGIQMANQGR